MLKYLKASSVHLNSPLSLVDDGIWSQRSVTSVLSMLNSFAQKPER